MQDVVTREVDSRCQPPLSSAGIRAILITCQLNQIESLTFKIMMFINLS